MQKKHIFYYFFVFVLQLVGFILLQARFQLVLLTIMIALPFYNVWALERVTDACTIDLCPPMEPMEGEHPVQIQLIVNNPTFNPLFHTTVTIAMQNKQQKKRGAHHITMPLRAHAKTRICYPVTPQGKGTVQIDSVEIELQDLLGFVKKKKLCQTGSISSI